MSEFSPDDMIDDLEIIDKTAWTIILFLEKKKIPSPLKLMALTHVLRYVAHVEENYSPGRFNGLLEISKEEYIKFIERWSEK